LDGEKPRRRGSLDGGEAGQMLNITNFINKTMWLWLENEKKAIPLEVIWP
jgi:hypothetical protein